jgi:hypothetical protein
VIYIAFTIGLLLGMVATFGWVSLLFRDSSAKKTKSILEFQERANDLLEERNEISRQQLAAMRKGGAND